VVVGPLANRHDRAAFSCGDKTLDRYLKEIASQDARRFIAAPFVLIELPQPNHICGFYTLSSFSIDVGSLPEGMARKLPRYPIIPATLLGRLAVDARYRGRGLGEYLLMDALHRAYVSEIKSFAVIVDAINKQAVSFYQHFEFIPFPNKSDRLFLPIKTIAALF
jgi:GNAT superfamily N-acetyltransferase